MNLLEGSKIAVVGSGISGLICTWLLQQKYQVTLFEKNDELGGHTATKDIEFAGRNYAIDTGFIVFNDWTYPNFNRFIDKLGVEYKHTEMSFSVTNRADGFEYNGNTLNTLFAQRRNIFKPNFYRFVNDILRFNKTCKQLIVDAGQPKADQILEQTLGVFLQENGFSDKFCQNYILPMGAAIWSSSVEDMKAFPLRFFCKFFHNHGLLNVTDRPQWSVIKGGSREYIRKLYPKIKDSVRLSSAITKVVRTEQGTELTINGEQTEQFDAVIFACHSDQALALLGDASNDEQQVLGDIEYQENEVVLHTDTRLLPKRKLAWAAWNYYLDENQSNQAKLTYNMNILQGIESPHTFCVTLNQTEMLDQAKILAKFNYAHPVYCNKSMQAQQQRHLINGQNNSFYCGAYWYNGFHEDGVKSALDVCKLLGVDGFE